MDIDLKNGPFLPEGRIKVTRRRGRRRKQLLDDFKVKRRYWKYKEDVLVGILWRTRFGRGGSGRVVSDGVRCADGSTHSGTVLRRTLWGYIDTGDKSEFCAAGNFGAQFLIGAVCGVGCTLYVAAIPLVAWSGPKGSRKLSFPDFMTTQDGGKVVSLTHRPLLPQIIHLVLISVRG